MKSGLFVILVAFLMLPGIGTAYDFDLGRQSGMGGGVLLTAPSATDRLTCPASTAIDRQIVFEAGYQRKFDLSDLDRFFIAAGYRYNNLSASVGFSQFGRNDYYLEQLIKATFSYSYKQLIASLFIDGKSVSVGEAENKVTLHAAAVGFAAGYSYEKYHLSFVVDNINRHKLEESLVPDNTVYHLYGEVEGISKLSIVGHLALEKYEKPLVSFGQHVRLVDEHSLFWGISSNPLMYGGGIEIKYKSYGLMYAVNYHPELGLTHNISLNVASVGLLD